VLVYGVSLGPTTWLVEVVRSRWRQWNRLCLSHEEMVVVESRDFLHLSCAYHHLHYQNLATSWINFKLSCGYRCGTGESGDLKKMARVEGFSFAGNPTFFLILKQELNMPSLVWKLQRFSEIRNCFPKNIWWNMGICSWYLDTYSCKISRKMQLYVACTKMKNIFKKSTMIWFYCLKKCKILFCLFPVDHIRHILTWKFTLIHVKVYVWII
jgi:hypothetical protein